MKKIKQDFNIANINTNGAAKTSWLTIILLFTTLVTSLLLTALGTASVVNDAKENKFDASTSLLLTVAFLGILNTINSLVEIIPKIKLKYDIKELENELEEQNNNINAATQSQYFFDFSLGLKVDIATYGNIIKTKNSTNNQEINSNKIKDKFEKIRNTANKLLREYPDKDIYDIFLIRARANHFTEHYKLALEDIIHYITYDPASILGLRLQAFIYRELAFRDINAQACIRYFNKAENIYFSMYEEVKNEGSYHKRFLIAIILIDWARLKYSIGMTFSSYRGSEFFKASNEFLQRANEIFDKNLKKINDANENLELKKKILLYKKIADLYIDINNLKLYKNSLPEILRIKDKYSEKLVSYNSKNDSNDNQKILLSEMIVVALSAYRYLASLYKKLNCENKSNVYDVQKILKEAISLLKYPLKEILLNLGLKIKIFKHEVINVKVNKPIHICIFSKDDGLIKINEIYNLHCASNVKIYHSILLVWIGKFEYKRALLTKNRIALKNSKILFSGAIEKDRENYEAINLYIKTYLHASEFWKANKLQKNDFNLESLERFVNNKLMPEGSLVDNLPRCYANISYAKVLLRLFSNEKSNDAYLIKAKEHLYKAKQHVSLNPDIYNSYKKVKNNIKALEASSNQVAKPFLDDGKLTSHLNFTK